MNYEENICEAIQTLIDKAFTKAGFNKTVQGIIESLEDSSTGRYRIRYQDCYFDAYAIDKSLTYAKGTSVWILVINGDMSNHKVIIDSISGNPYSETPYSIATESDIEDILES